MFFSPGNPAQFCPPRAPEAVFGPLIREREAYFPTVNHVLEATVRQQVKESASTVGRMRHNILHHTRCNCAIHQPETMRNGSIKRNKSPIIFDSIEPRSSSWRLKELPMQILQCPRNSGLDIVDQFQNLDGIMERES